MITLPLAVFIESVHQRLKTVFRTIYYLPTVTASVAVALVWGVIYNPTFGLLNLAVLKETADVPLAINVALQQIQQSSY